MGSAAGLGVSTFGEDGFGTLGGDGFGIAGGMGVSARADALMIKAIAATMAKVRMLASSPDHSPQSSLIQGTDLHGSEMIRADHSPPMLGSVGRVKPPWTSVPEVPTQSLPRTALDPPTERPGFAALSVEDSRTEHDASDPRPCPATSSTSILCSRRHTRPLTTNVKKNFNFNCGPSSLGWGEQVEQGEPRGESLV